MRVCGNELAGHYCELLWGHPGACAAAKGYWWPKHSSGRNDLQPYSPETDHVNMDDFRKAWQTLEYRELGNGDE